MADKGKRRKTVGRGSGSQTRNLNYNSDMFRSVGCEKLYESIPRKVKFIQEKALRLAPGEFEEIRQNISNRGWDEYVRHPRVASQALVFEFFSNVFPRPGDESLQFPASTSYVRGHNVPFDATTINRIFGVAQVDLPDCLLRNKINKKRVKENPARAAEIRATVCKPGFDWVRNASGEPQNILATSLTPVARGWANFISHTMCPTSNHSELSFDRANLISCIIQGEPVNLGWILEHEINEFAEFKKGVLPRYWRHASLVALLCEEAGVVAGPDEAIVEPLTAITGSWIRARAGLEQQGHMEEPQHEQPVHMEEPQQEEQEPMFSMEDIPLGPTMADFNDLQARMDVLILNQDRMSASQEEMRQTLGQMARNQEEMRQILEQLARNQMEMRQPPPQ